MRGSSRSSSSLAALVGIGTFGLLVFIVVTIAGGFAVELGSLRLTVFDWRRPAAWALASWAIAVFAFGRHAVSAHLSDILPRLDRHGIAIAVVLGAATAGAGVAFGTHAVSSSDASAYVSQAELLASGRIVQEEPLARAVRWPDSAWVFAPLGYRPGASPGQIVPTYPPGLPMVMALTRILGEWGPFLVVPLFGALAVWSTYRLGATLHTRVAGLVAASLLATSPVFLFQLVQPMSDVPAAALWTAALLLALRRGARFALASGVVSGLALLVRPNLLSLAPVVALVASGWPRRPNGGPHHVVRTFLTYALGVAPAAVALLGMQWRAFGHPLASGHGAFGDFFALANVWPNLWDYSVRLVRGEWPALVLAFVGVVASIAWRPREGPAGAAHAIRLTAAVMSALLLCYLPYGVFPDWSYLRFLLPAFPIGFVACGALFVNACTRLPLPMRGLTVLVATTLVCASNVSIARAEQVFNLRRYEGRYRLVGRYLDTALPASAVIITAQESGSARFYTKRPIVRWDFLSVDLDVAVSDLAALGLDPVLLVEDWEETHLRAKFPMSRLASLDWRPRAEIGAETKVRLYAPSDRAGSPSPRWLDRF